MLGQVYEYFLEQFAIAEGRKGGEFYTPRSVVRLLVEMIEPYEGRVFDPCCGSAGMFVQSVKFIESSVSGIADEDGLANATFAYQWIRTDGSTDTQIAGATGASYTLVNDDKGKTVKVRVSFTDGAGHEEALTGAATAAIAPPPLTASLHTDDTPENHDGDNTFTFELRFSEELGVSYVTLRDYAFTINGGVIVNANRVSPPSNLRWRITVQAGLRRRCERHARHRHKL